MNFDLNKQEEFADRQLNLINNSAKRSNDRELYKQAIESIETVNRIIPSRDNESYHNTSQARERYKKIATGTSTEEISSLTKKLIDKGQIWQASDIQAIKDIVMKFNSEMNIQENNIVNHDNMSVVSSISMVPTNNENINSQAKSDNLQKKSVRSNSRNKRSELIKDLSTDSFDINVKMDLRATELKEQKSEDVCPKDISSLDLNIRNSNYTNSKDRSHHEILDRKDSKISVQSGSSGQSQQNSHASISQNSVISQSNINNKNQYSNELNYIPDKNDMIDKISQTKSINRDISPINKNNKKEIESIDQEIKLKRKQVMDLKKKNKELISQKDELLKETHGMSQNDLLLKSKTAERGQAEQQRSKLEQAEKYNKINNQIIENDKILSDIFIKQKDLLHSKEKLNKK